VVGLGGGTVVVVVVVLLMLDCCGRIVVVWMEKGKGGKKRAEVVHVPYRCWARPPHGATV